MTEIHGSRKDEIRKTTKDMMKQFKHHVCRENGAVRLVKVVIVREGESRWGVSYYYDARSREASEVQHEILILILQ